MHSISNIPDSFRKRLKEGRTYAGFKTQEALADEMGVTRSSIAKWENGVNLPPLDTLLTLCNSLKCDIGYLFGEHEERRRVAADICAETGLTEEAVERLQNWTTTREYVPDMPEEDVAEAGTILRFIDELIYSVYFEKIVEHTKSFQRCLSESKEKLQSFIVNAERTSSDMDPETEKSNFAERRKEIEACIDDALKSEYRAKELLGEFMEKLAGVKKSELRELQWKYRDVCRSDDGKWPL